MIKFFRDVFSLVAPYWRSEEKISAWILLAAIIGFNLGLVYLNILLNEWNNEFYNALQDVDRKGFFDAIIKFSWIAALFIINGVYSAYLNQMLQIRWRRWMTSRYTDIWLDRKTYYRMKVVEKQSDNPDQRIADDIGQFIDLTLGLTLGLLNAVVTLFSFLFILWKLSGILEFTVWDHPIAIPGSMVWAALIYAFIGTYLTVKLGKPLIPLNFNQHRFEADFRFSLVRLREYSESIAFYSGEEQEKRQLAARFAGIFNNYWRIMLRRRTLTWFTSIYQQIAVIVPYLVVAPRFFAGKLRLGGVMQTASAFGQVQGALSYVVNTFTNIAVWKAVVDRLTGFLSSMAQTNKELDENKKFIIQTSTDNALHVAHMTLRLPDGYVLLRNIELTVARGDTVLLKGLSGSGKSTLLRALAGLWPYAEGEYSIPADAVSIFVPQKPYLPLGRLREAICYPGDSLRIDDAAIKAALATCHLNHLADRLDKAASWARILSLGEQQRMAFARLLLLKPEIIFLDEATSALDEGMEDYLYGLLKGQLPQAIVISVGHRQTMEKWHNKIVAVETFR